MRHLPVTTYSGLTIVLSNPSRFDRDSFGNIVLLEGYAGSWFRNECLGPNLKHSCDIRTISHKIEGFLPGTKCVLLLGDMAKRAYLGTSYDDRTLGQQRGNHILDGNTGIVYMCSYSVQDAFDRVDHEGHLNTAAIKLEQENYVDIEDSSDTDDAEKESKEDPLAEKTRHGRTKRTNWKFWLEQDTKKLIRILSNGGKIPKPAHLSSIIPRVEFAPQLYQICQILEYQISQNEDLFLDIETTDNDYHLSCIGLGIGTREVFVIPIWDYRGNLFYSNIHRFAEALAIGMHRARQVVTHNGSGFDYIVLGKCYRIPFPRRNYDTMLASHRCYPEVEKSLGHGLSLYTYEEYHKDEGIYDPKTTQQQEQLWNYNAKDIVGTMKLKAGIEEHSSGKLGLKSSIELANNCIYPYLISTFQGIAYEQEKLDEMLASNDILLTQMLRWINILLGDIILSQLADGKPVHKLAPLPSSPKQCVTYFHEIMNYSVAGRSRDTGKPSLDKKALYKLRISAEARDNPILDMILRFRLIRKESSAFGEKYTPHWRE